MPRLSIATDGVDVKEVGSQETVGLCSEERDPLAARICRLRVGLSPAARLIRRMAGWADHVVEPALLTMYAAKASMRFSVPSPVAGSADLLRYQWAFREGGRVHFFVTRRWYQASSVRGETIRRPRSR